MLGQEIVFACSNLCDLGFSRVLNHDEEPFITFLREAWYAPDDAIF